MTRRLVGLLVVVSVMAPVQEAQADNGCVSIWTCPQDSEIIGDGTDNDGDGIELRWVLFDSGNDSDFSTTNELLGVAAGWSETYLALAFHFTLETNAMIWYLELGLEGGEDNFLSPEAGGTYQGSYPSDVVFTEKMDLMIATYGTFPLTVHRLFEDGSEDITDTVALSCLDPNCQDGTEALGYVRIAWDTLYQREDSRIPPALTIKVAGIIRARDNGAPADIAPDNPESPIDTYLVLPVDTDGDGVPDQGFYDDDDGDGFSPLEGDCDDTAPDVYPNAPEQCNGIDDDCDGQVPSNEQDRDGDGFLACDDDCNDHAATVNPDAREVCDGLDNNCDGTIDEGYDLDMIGGADCLDNDGDGFDEWNGDCNDDDATWVPGGDDWCDGFDNNCDGIVDEGFDQDGIGGSDCVDNDGDGLTEDQGDCDDTQSAIHPGATEVCDGADNDCDGQVDEGFDSDGIGGPDCTDDDGDGFSEDQGDCNDTTAHQKPGRPELCDGIDNNCDGQIDEGFDADGIGGVDCVDNDGDGYTEDQGDCNDVDPRVYTGAVEQCDGVDNNCNGQIDEGFDSDGIGGVDCADNDGDGVTEFGGDCNDENPDQYAGAVEQCDGVDNDCDGRVDEGFDNDGDATSDCVDDDWDGFTEQDGDCDDSNPDVSPANEERPGNEVDENCDGVIEDADGDGAGSQDGDCDDSNPSIYPGADDVCDDLDNDCDGQVDEGTVEVCFDGIDNDCDGVVDEGAPETCNGIDDDCDGRIDNGVRYVESRGVCVTEPGFSCSLSGRASPPASSVPAPWLVIGVALCLTAARRQVNRDR